jgi:hypothetical protein
MSQTGVPPSIPANGPTSTANGTGPSPGTEPDPSHSSSTDGTQFPPLPDAPPSHHVGAGWSAAHPIPTVAGYKAAKERHQKEADEYASIVAKRAQEAENRQRTAEAANDENEKEDVGGKPVAGDEKNVAKANQDKNTEPSAGAGANEKSRLMEQMNANKRE